MTSAAPDRYLYYVSYSGQDRMADEQLFRAFIDDVNEEVSAYSGYPLDKTGFCDIYLTPSKVDPPERQIAFATSSVLLALYSPGYFRNERCVQEWQSYRYRQTFADKPREVRAILPVIFEAGDYLSDIPSPAAWIRAADPGGGVRSHLEKRDDPDYKAFLSQLARDIYGAAQENMQAGMPELPRFAHMLMPRSWDVALMDAEGQPTEDALAIRAQLEDPNRPEPEPETPDDVQPSETADERVPAHDDIPASVDELGRRPFAEVLAARMREVWHSQSAAGAAQSNAGAFMLNLHGPWGAGKTSVLNLIRADLQTARPPEQPWVVIDYNAWMHQRIQPPWWSLIKAVYSQSVQQLGFWQGWWLRIRWFFWRAWADLVPTLIAVVAVAIALMAATGVFNVLGFNEDLSQNAANVLKGVTTLAGLGGALYVFSRSLVFGSASAAQTYAEGRSDPLVPIVRLFAKLIRGIKRPVAVFIDDLDRCDSDYVVKLLEGIQTLFRSVPLVYVVAADRKWICASYEKAYQQFTGPVGEPGRPLGYLFLDKIFQASAAIPQISEEYRQKFWGGLLSARPLADTAAIDKELQVAEAAALQSIGGTFSQEQLQAQVDAAARQTDPTVEQAMRAAAAKQITTPAAAAIIESRLQPLGALLEPNPRSMKRLVNAYGFHQAAHFLEGRNVTPEALARWTIIELRWPLLAELLAERPQTVTEFLTTVAGDSTISPEFRPLCGNEELVMVLTGSSDGLAGALDEAAVREITGTRTHVRTNGEKTSS